MRLSPLVSTAWLAERLGDATVRVLDASWYLPSMQRDARREYRAQHVPGAGFFDLDLASDPASPLPHTLPTADAFARYASALGVGDAHTAVIYDGSGVNLSAPRAWWLFRAFGHRNVAVLDGGLVKWTAEARPLEAGDVSAKPARLAAQLDASCVRDLDTMHELLRTGMAQVVDVRPAGRFAGTTPEPRAGLRGGHMPHSLNLPFTELVRPDGTVLPLAELRAKLAAAGVRFDRPVVATCGSGTTACALLLNLERLGARDHALYDGSWAEWGGREDTEVETAERTG